MPSAELKLVVLRAIDLDRSVRFYGALGISLQRERHGNGPEHLAGQIGPNVFEIYPQGDGDGTQKTQIGFTVDSITALIPRLQEAGGTMISPPQNSPWGIRAVVADPDGHRVELIAREIPSACPRCSAPVVRIITGLFGYLSDADRIAIEADEAILGGERNCNQPTWVCMRCVPEWAEVHRLAWQDHEWQLAKEQAVEAHEFELARQFRDHQYETRRPLRELVAMLVKQPPAVD